VAGALRAGTSGSCCARGFHAGIDSYSAFYENDRRTRTGLNGYLRERGFRRLFLAGLAFDFCVLWSAEDACRLGFEAVVIEDACRSMDLAGSHAAAHRRRGRHARAERGDLRGAGCHSGARAQRASPLGRRSIPSSGAARRLRLHQGSRPLSSELLERDAQSRARDLHHPAIGLVHFEDHEDRARKCQCGDEQSCGHARISWRKGRSWRR
jgi:hypothetical protein